MLTGEAIPGVDLSTFPFAPTFENQVNATKMTTTQRRVAEMLVQGYGPHEIARRLNGNKKTVKCHLRQLFDLYAIDTWQWAGSVRLVSLLMLPPGSRLREQMERTR